MTRHLASFGSTQIRALPTGTATNWKQESDFNWKQNREMPVANLLKRWRGEMDDFRTRE